MTSPVANKDASISIMTSVGFQQLPVNEFVEIGQRLRPDILVGLGDVSFGSSPGLRKLDKMFTRTERWTKQLMEATPCEIEGQTSAPALFAPILPVSLEQQRWYLDLLEDDLRRRLSGLALYDADTMVELPESLRALPRLCLTQQSGPHETLREIALGADILTLPFVNEATDAGIALDFAFSSFRKPDMTSMQKPLGHNMWLSHYATSLKPLVEDCSCYTCTKHHCAYVQHLLSAKEMLAWVLLQIHNMNIMSAFFTAVRESISDENFEVRRAAFEQHYQRKLPERTGAGPR